MPGGFILRKIIGGGIFILVIISLCIFLFRGEIDNLFNSDKIFSGNYGGNIVNGGIVTENNKYVFISSAFGKSVGIFRKSKEDDEILKISNDRALYLNAFGDELYYVNIDDNGKIYKIDDDGDNKEKMADFENCEYFNFNNDGVFFEYSEEGRVYLPYSLDVDFGNLTKLSDNEAENLVFNDGYLYYSNWNDGGKIYRMKTDGSESSVLNDSYSSFINICDGYVYYINDDDSYKIYKVKEDGSENTLVCEDSANYLNVYGGYIYYSNESDENKLYRVKIDGTEKFKISDDFGGFSLIADNRVYYIKSSDGNLYSMNFDGSDCKIVLE